MMPLDKPKPRPSSADMEAQRAKMAQVEKALPDDAAKRSKALRDGSYCDGKVHWV